MQLDDRMGNWVEDRVDVGFRVGASASEGVIARRLVNVQLDRLRGAGYLARHGAPSDLNELTPHRCSVFRHPSTGKVLPWWVKVGDGVIEHEVVPALCANVEELEVEAVLAGQLIGQLFGVTAAPYIRSGRLVPLLTQHVADHLGLFVYYGSRSALPARVRAFIDLAVQRVSGNPAFQLSAKELAAAEAKGRKARPRRSATTHAASAA